MDWPLKRPVIEISQGVPLFGRLIWSLPAGKITRKNVLQTLNIKC